MNILFIIFIFIITIYFIFLNLLYFYIINNTFIKKLLIIHLFYIYYIINREKQKYSLYYNNIRL